MPVVTATHRQAWLLPILADNAVHTGTARPQVKANTENIPFGDFKMSAKKIYYLFTGNYTWTNFPAQHNSTN
ncbi:hypothetical protein DSM19430T_00720 [Desulfovibrio psychrotolerans]|uniref:Uncharacterized protein n=1 Tax=Desulfovibrio psychrotolerans TaxID=415242 RepID=A0A7J0BP47_9BACT|nr:hypothetical protein DSM19430T_00720 [Desulfovibrio psychrotolerans]